MFALILIVILGLGMALFAQQNAAIVSITIGPYSFAAVPLYIVVILSTLVGLFVAWILSVMDFFSHSFTLRSKDSAINHAERRIADLENETSILKEENALLRGEQRVETHEVHEERTLRKPFFEHLKERFTHHDRKEAYS